MLHIRIAILGLPYYQIKLIVCLLALDHFKEENIALCARVVISVIHSTFFRLKLKTLPRYLKLWTISTFSLA